MSEVYASRIVRLVCPKHGEYTGDAVTFNLFGHKGVEVNPMCPICQNEIEADERRKEEELEKHRAIQKWRSMNIEPKLTTSTPTTMSFAATCKRAGILRETRTARLSCWAKTETARRTLR